MRTDDTTGDDLDRLLDQELQRRLGWRLGPSAQFQQSAYYAAFFAQGDPSSALASPTRGLVKTAAGLVSASLIVGAGAAIAVASTGSPDPGVWGQTVNAAVSTCKDQLAGGERGIGQCVRAVARQQGADQRATHSASGGSQSHPGTSASEEHPASLPSSAAAGQSQAHPSASAESQSNAVGAGQAKTHPTGPLESHPKARPTGVPPGPPASLPVASPGSHPTGPPVSPPPHP
jgi:hypothetical protein